MNKTCADNAQIIDELDGMFRFIIHDLEEIDYYLSESKQHSEPDLILRFRKRACEDILHYLGSLDEYYESTAAGIFNSLNTKMITMVSSDQGTEVAAVKQMITKMDYVKSRHKQTIFKTQEGDRKKDTGLITLRMESENRRQQSASKR